MCKGRLKCKEKRAFSIHGKECEESCPTFSCPPVSSIDSLMTIVRYDTVSFLPLSY